MSTTYKIGEAAALLNLKTYVLRFWETEFPEIVPLRTEKGQRLYTEGHLALLERIRYLLHERGLTIGGARKILAEEKERGVDYVFGAPSAVVRQDMQNGLLLDPEYEDVVLEEESAPPALELATENGSLPRALTDDPRALRSGFVFPPSEAPGRSGGARQRPQCNLPGLDELVAIRAAMAADDADTAAENQPEEPACNKESEDFAAQGMLPLFAMVRTAFLAGRAAGASLPGAGGDNFIQAGADRAGAAATSLPLPSGGVSANSLSRLLVELEQVASLLRDGGAVPVHSESRFKKDAPDAS